MQRSRERFFRLLPLPAFSFCRLGMSQAISEDSLCLLVEEKTLVSRGSARSSLRSPDIEPNLRSQNFFESPPQNVPRSKFDVQTIQSAQRRVEPARCRFLSDIVTMFSQLPTEIESSRIAWRFDSIGKNQPRKFPYEERVWRARSRREQFSFQSNMQT